METPPVFKLLQNWSVKKKKDESESLFEEVSPAL